jgi:uncharacterized membrane protein (DUF2068 family)
VLVCKTDWAFGYPGISRLPDDDRWTRRAGSSPEGSRLCAVLTTPCGGMERKGDSDPWLRVIAFFKLIKAVLFFAAGIGVLHFFNKDVSERAQRVLDHLHVDPDNRYGQALIEQVGRMTNTNLKLLGLSVISFFYSGLFGTEGTGLFLRKPWAEWFVVIVTGSLLPFEIYEIAHKVSALKIGVTAVNLLILAYLVVVIRRKKK